jgi:hypothetical protein
MTFKLKHGVCNLKWVIIIILFIILQSILVQPLDIELVNNIV